MSFRTLRLIWFCIIATALAVVIHLFFGSVLAASEEGASEIVVRDLITPSEQKHELYGMVMAPSACHELNVRAQDFDPKTVVLVFEFWEQPYRDCIMRDTPRAFRVVAFAPAAIEFKSIVENAWTPVRVIREIADEIAQ